MAKPNDKRDAWLRKNFREARYSSRGGDPDGRAETKEWRKARTKHLRQQRRREERYFEDYV